MKSTILGVLKSAQEYFGIHHKTLTYIEGGLGSQILSVISFYNQQDKFGKSLAKCDLSYFDYNNQADLWEWNLHNYGINLEDLRKFQSHSRLNILLAKKDFLTGLEISQDYWKVSRTKYLDRFPINEEQLQVFLYKVSNKFKPTSYGAIHIRRGDYLQVASKVIELDEYIKFLENIKSVLPKFSFIITDSPLSPSERQQLTKAIGIDRETIILDGPGYDSFILHCLMRSADVLITSNSTFSFSAGLLGREGQTVFSPLEFHTGKGSEKYNRTFRSVGSFTSWNLDNPRGTI